MKGMHKRFEMMRWWFTLITAITLTVIVLTIVGTAVVCPNEIVANLLKVAATVISPATVIRGRYIEFVLKHCAWY